MKTQHSKKNKSAFTLIELLVVIAIILVTVGIISGAYSLDDFHDDEQGQFEDE